MYAYESFLIGSHCVVILAEASEWTSPTTKFGSVVKTDDATHTPREYEKLYYSHYEAFWGVWGGFQGGPEIERAGKGAGLGGQTVVGRRGWVRLLHKERP